jgi:thioredoxin-like negative regulator of GroEL
MATAEKQVARRAPTKPRLIFFTSSLSGHCRRVEGFLAQVLQRRRNHATFRLLRVDETQRPDLVELFRVTDVPTLVVVQGRSEKARLEHPRGCREIEELLSPWLR